MTQKYPFLKPFIILFFVGLIGVISLLFITIPQLDQIGSVQPELAELPSELLIFLSVLQPIILLIIANVIGCLVAPRVGFVSFIYEKIVFGKSILSRLKPQFILALTIGLIYSVIVIVLDMAFLPFMGEEFKAIKAQELNIFAQLGMGMLYGGITEELLLRWGFMSFLVWLGCLLLRRSGVCNPPKSLVWVAIFLSAIVFGVGHLPAMAAMVPLTTIIIVRTILLNAIGGIVFGWLYWKYSLEAAMISHAFAHVGFFIVKLLSLAFN